MTMNANELADAMEIRASIRRQATSRKSVQENANDRLADQLEQAATMLRQQQAEIEALNQRIERMIENASHNEGIAHAGGFEQGHEVGRQLGMKQERAMWELSASTQEIDQHLTMADAPFQKPAPKELADEIDKALGIKQ